MNYKKLAAVHAKAYYELDREAKHVAQSYPKYWDLVNAAYTDLVNAPTVVRKSRGGRTLMFGVLTGVAIGYILTETDAGKNLVYAGKDAAERVRKIVQSYEG